MAPPTEQAQTKWRPALAALEGRIKEHNMMALLRLELERESARSDAHSSLTTAGSTIAVALPAYRERERGSNHDRAIHQRHRHGGGGPALAGGCSSQLRSAASELESKW